MFIVDDDLHTGNAQGQKKCALKTAPARSVLDKAAARRWRARRCLLSPRSTRFRTILRSPITGGHRGRVKAKAQVVGAVVGFRPQGNAKSTRGDPLELLGTIILPKIFI